MAAPTSAASCPRPGGPAGRLTLAGLGVTGKVNGIGVHLHQHLAVSVQVLPVGAQRGVSWSVASSAMLYRVTTAMR